MILLSLLLATAEPQPQVTSQTCLEIRQTMLETRHVVGLPMDTIDSIYERCLRSDRG